MKCHDFPTYLLPNVVEPGMKINDTISVFNSEKYIPVTIYAALGDLQCSVFSCLEFETDCGELYFEILTKSSMSNSYLIFFLKVINISTSSQICMVVDKKHYNLIKSDIPKSVNILPYFNNNVLLAVTSLNGGNVLEKFVDMIIQWNLDLSIISENHTDYKEMKQKIWENLILQGQKFSEQNLQKMVVCKPLFFAERYDKENFASIHNISNGHDSVGEIFVAICRGIVKNLKQMMTEELLFNKLKCKRIIATGSTILKNNVLKKQLESEFYPLTIVYKATGDAALGACSFLKEIILKEKQVASE
jgi:hypothetical protein